MIKLNRITVISEPKNDIFKYYNNLFCYEYFRLLELIQKTNAEIFKNTKL